MTSRLSFSSFRYSFGSSATSSEPVLTDSAGDNKPVSIDQSDPYSDPYARKPPKWGKEFGNCPMKYEEELPADAAKNIFIIDPSPQNPNKSSKVYTETAYNPLNIHSTEISEHMPVPATQQQLSSASTANSSNTSYYGIGTLYNIGNSCYINAGIQMLLVDGFLTERINGLLNRDTSAENSLEPKNHEVILALKNVCELMRFTNDNRLFSALYNFRSSLFKSGINDDLKFDHVHKYSRQHDGATFLDALLNLLDYKISTREITTLKSDEGDLVDKRIENATVTLFRLNFVPAASSSFQTLFDRYFDEHNNNTEENSFRYNQNLYKNYSRQTQICGNPPEFLPIQMVRMLGQNSDLERAKLTMDSRETAKKTIDPTELTGADLDTTIEKMVPNDPSISSSGIRKIHDKAPFPENEMIDAKRAFGSRDPVPYAIVSFECHIGQNPDGGHYICYRKENGQWVKYDDRTMTKVTKKEAHETMSQAYNILLKKQNFVIPNLNSFEL